MNCWLRPSYCPDRRALLARVAAHSETKKRTFCERIDRRLACERYSPRTIEDCPRERPYPAVMSYLMLTLSGSYPVWKHLYCSCSGPLAAKND